MFIQSLNCRACSPPTLSGMAEFDPVSIGTSLLKIAAGGGGGGGGGGASAPSVSVNTSNQVSPQISPQFVQQSSPSNSPVSFSANQNANPLPGLPATGFIPGFDAGAGTGTGAGYVYPQSTVQSSPNYQRYALIAAGLIGAALLYKYRTQIAGHARRGYARARGAFR